MNNHPVPVSLRSWIQEGGIVVRAPGRINLLGEHTDYNDGFVLPAAIDKAIYLTAIKEDSQKASLFSVDFNESIEITIDGILPIPGHWATYILGVVDQLKKRNYPVTGFAMSISGDLPLGAGLSSSAAIESAVAIALNELFEFGIAKNELMLIAQKAEHEFAYVQCGIMDQFASLFGKKDHVVKLDCRSMEYEYFPFRIEGYQAVLFDSGVKHALASTEYNIRRQECEEAVEMLKGHYPSIRSLRDVTLRMIEAHTDSSPVIFKRSKYVVEENIRVLEGCEDLAKDNIEAFGKKMFATHAGLSKDYEVSCSELDLLVDMVKGFPAVVGSRMMGGGFGGCTINIIKEDQVDRVTEHVSSDYKKNTGRELQAYLVKIGDGASVINC